MRMYNAECQKGQQKVPRVKKTTGPAIAVIGLGQILESVSWRHSRWPQQGLFELYKLEDSLKDDLVAASEVDLYCLYVSDCVAFLLQFTYIFVN